MSADTPTRPPQADVGRGGADQVKPATPPADARRPHGDARPRQPPGTQTRQDHADAMLANPPGRTRDAPAHSAPAHRDSRQDGQPQPERGPAPKPETGQQAGHRPQALLRQDHADALLANAPGRTPQAPARTAPTGRDSRQAGRAPEQRAPEQPLTPSRRHDGQPAGMPITDKAGGGESHPVPRPEAGHPAGGDQAGEIAAQAGDETTSPKGRHHASAHTQREAGSKPEKVTFDGKELEVTHNAVDGIWVEGLPGEPPARIGDVLPSPERGDRSRIEDFRQELNKDAEGIIDTGGKWTDLVRDAFAPPPPTHSMTSHRGPELTAGPVDHAVSIGQGVEAAITLAIVGTAAAHKLHEWWQGTRERRLERREADHARN